MLYHVGSGALNQAVVCIFSALPDAIRRRFSAPAILQKRRNVLLQGKIDIFAHRKSFIRLGSTASRRSLRRSAGVPSVKPFLSKIYACIVEI